MTRLQIGGPVRAIAHRGDQVGHRENTLPGIASALRAGADVIEIDVKATADGVVVLLHDLSLERFWGRSQLVTGLEYAALPRGAESEETFPTLTDALALISGTAASLLIDMDSPAWAAPSLAVVRAAVADGLVRPDQAVWCGRDDSLGTVRDFDARARIILSWDETNGGGRPPGDDIVRRLCPEAYNPHWPMLTAEAIHWAHARDMATCCWTVDDELRMAALLDLGVEAMISNQIATLRRVIDDRGR